MLKFSRRDFLKYGLTGLGVSFLMPPDRSVEAASKPRYMLVGAKDGVSIYREPDERSVIMYQRLYNEVITVYDEVIGPNGPGWNPIWYRCWGGYVFSGYLYEVKYQLNEISRDIRAGGQLGEITMPYTRSLFYSRWEGWIPVYLLYYRSMHWVMDVIDGPDGRPWYKVKDELMSAEYSVPAEHVRLIPDDEFVPISPEVPLGEKNIYISLGKQTLEAYEGDTKVFQTKISSGSPTPEGTYNIQVKMPSKHMGLGNLTSFEKAHEYVGVPWNGFFEMTEGMATHGAFWHMNYGTPMSAGCINMRIDEAKWIYMWTTPIAEPGEWSTHGYGTPIHISKD